MLTETHQPHSAHVKMNRGELLKPEWTGDPEITGGFLYETPIHMFDMMRFLFGEVESLACDRIDSRVQRGRRFLGAAEVCERHARDARDAPPMRVGCFRLSASKFFAIMQRS